MKIQSFGKASGKEIKEFILEYDGVSVSIINYGAIVTKFIYNGIDVVLGYDTLGEYIATTDYYGATVGRVCNRIANGEFELNGKKYFLAKNNGENFLHGGIQGFNKKVFDYEQDGEKLILTYLSKDGEENFPANLLVKITYYLDGEGLHIEFSAQADGDTLCNLTNHSFFNLNGQGNGDILGHKLTIDGDYILPINENYVPTGDKMSVKDTPFDFSTQTEVGKRVNEDNRQLKIAGGYDHAYVLNGNGMRKVAALVGDKTGIKLEVVTDALSLQFYGGNFLDNDKGKGGKVYGYRSAICLESQGYPNAINCPEYPSVVIKKGESYSSKTIYKLYKEKA
jgi:aldose 1-epimerase